MSSQSAAPTTDIESTEAEEHAGEDEHPPPENFLWRYVFTLDHKIIGLQYIASSIVWLLLGGLLAMGIRTELMYPVTEGGPILLNPGSYNEFFTMHGTIMVFFAVIPLLTGGFGNYLVPIMIGAKDMAFPRLNSIAFWLIPSSGLVLISGFILDQGAAAAGWTAYPPLSALQPVGQSAWLVSIILLGNSSMMAAINVLVTVINMRAPGMNWGRLPIFVWTMVVTSVLVLLVIPLLSGGMLMLLLQRVAGMQFFTPPAGEPLLWQHLFWFFGHPEVYIVVLPAMGLISEVIPTFSRKPIFGYPFIVGSSMAIGTLSFLVWGHHMFSSGMSPYAGMGFMISTMLIAVPSGVKVFNWVATLWRGSITLNTPMLYALGFVSMFMIGGFSGLMLAVTPFDLHVHDTYFVVGHFHLVMVGAAVMAIFSGLYYWFPKMFGKMYNEFLGQIHFWLTFIFFNTTFLPMQLAGLAGMRRRIFSYPEQYADINYWISMSAFVLGAAQIIFFVNLVWSLMYGEEADKNPWDAKTLEWTVESPAPFANFKETPTVTSWPYDYGGPVDDELETQAKPMSAYRDNSG
jgi:cytochrome c oxidase subunit 1